MDAQWWLARIGDTVLWARLTVREGGTAEVLDGSGALLNYDSEDSARAALMDAGFAALDGLDDEDAAALGIDDVGSLRPPQADDLTTLVRSMSWKIAPSR